MAKIIGLTGGIGSGKSSVAALLAQLGATVIDADAIVHELQAPGAPLLREIAEAFGPSVLDASGALDREALAAIVFRAADQRSRLNAIVHPRVGAELARRAAKALEAGADLVVLDVPLLFEGRGGTAARTGMDTTLVVYAAEPIQIERTVARDGCTRDEAVRRIRAQLPMEEKKRLADYVIDNSGTREETEAQVRVFFDAIMSAPGAGGP
ncbi:MAG: dephospho-CoA kinase [Myxococcota bacterium]